MEGPFVPAGIPSDASFRQDGISMCAIRLPSIPRPRLLLLGMLFLPIACSPAPSSRESSREQTPTTSSTPETRLDTASAANEDPFAGGSLSTSAAKAQPDKGTSAVVDVRKPAEEVELKVVKYDKLVEAVKAQRGRVVVVDIWGNSACRARPNFQIWSGCTSNMPGTAWPACR
jgi:hypothetical protein